MVKCEKHPKYRGRRAPKYECVTCLELYSLIGLKPRAPILPTKTVPSKKEYDRQKEKKISEE